MSSKRYKKLPEKTNELQSEKIENVLTSVKSNCTFAAFSLGLPRYEVELIIFWLIV